MEALSKPGTASKPLNLPNSEPGSETSAIYGTANIWWLGR
jgi:hypothetical protein